MMTSTAYVQVKELGYRYSFDGVTAISHALSLKVSTDSESSKDSDFVNSARNEPDVLTLSVIASDASVPVIGWSRQTLASLIRIKELRLLCRVVTSLRTCDDMLLSSLDIQQDETCPDGWTGTLTFTHVNPPPAETKKENNSSTPTSSGSSAAKNLGPPGGSVLQTVLREAGILK